MTHFLEASGRNQVHGRLSLHALRKSVGVQLWFVVGYPASFLTYGVDNIFGLDIFLELDIFVDFEYVADQVEEISFVEGGSFWTIFDEVELYCLIKWSYIP